MGETTELQLAWDVISVREPLILYIAVVDTVSPTEGRFRL